MVLGFLGSDAERESGSIGPFPVQDDILLGLLCFTLGLL